MHWFQLVSATLPLPLPEREGSSSNTRLPRRGAPRPYQAGRTRLNSSHMLSRALHPFRRAIIAVVLLLTGFAPAAAVAQEGSVLIEVERPEDIGLEGFVRPGTWAPMKLTLRNSLPTTRKLAVDWIARDADGDLVIARRENVVIAKNDTATVRLYAMPATAVNPSDGWTVRVVDMENDQVVASKKVAPRHVAPLRTSLIGVTSGGLMGLASFRETHTQHEPMEIITGIDPATLPDRWYGMKVIDALVWSPSAARSPADPSVPVAAIKEWVRRGGHLVIILSAVDTGWSDPKLADLLPPVNIGEAVEVEPPRWLFHTSDEVNFPPEPERFVGIKFTVRPLTRRPGATSGDASLIFPGDPNMVVPALGEPALVAAHQYGFGRVTLVGIDITDRRMASNVAFVRFGLTRLWQTVFTWRSPGNLHTSILLDERRMIPLNVRRERDLPDVIGGRISMKTTAAATLFAAVVLFGVYWVVAGPGMFAALKTRKMLHHSWLVFGVVVLLFSAVTWLAAMFMRPGQTEIEHFSIVDIDASGPGPALIRSHSYCSLFVPRHGSVDLAVEVPKDRANGNALASPGLPGSDRSSFVDEQRYTINTLAVASSPAVPIRSTAKQFEVQYCDILDDGPFARRWSRPDGKLRLTSGWPTGELTHHLPGMLTNVRVIYCPGDGMPPMLTMMADKWEPGTVLSIRNATTTKLVVNPNLVVKPGGRTKSELHTKPNGWEARTIGDEGYLGAIIKSIIGDRRETDDEGQVKVVDPGAPAIVNRLELMTFFSMLPPPNFMADDDGNVLGSRTPVHFVRSIARTADLSHLTSLRRVIILGHIDKNSPLPAPVTVDGDEIDSSGWTMVRFVLGVESE